MRRAKKISLVIQVIFYLAAGINHFRSPGGYLAIIPGWLPWHHLINILAGCFEITFAVLLIFPLTRRIAAIGIILMLIAFLPVHIAMIGHAPLKLGSITVTPFMAWIRLVIFQPLLMYWAWLYFKK